MPSDTDDEARRRHDAARLAALEGKLAKARPADRPAAGQMGAKFDQANLAWRMVIELVAGLLIGFGIGYGLDWLFGTRPILLVLFIFAGLAAGVNTMLRTARELGAGPPGANPPGAATEQPDGAAVQDDDEDEER